MADNLELQVSTFLKENFGKWNSFIKNRDEFENKLSRDEEELFSKGRVTTIADLIKISLILLTANFVFCYLFPLMALNSFVQDFTNRTQNTK